MPDNVIYLDHAAATPLDDRVLQVMTPFFSTTFYNPSSPYAPAVEVRRTVDEARSRIARVLGVRPDELIFTSGATESVNLAFHGTLHGGGSALVPSIEHHAVLAAAGQYVHQIVAPTRQGVVRPEAVAALIRPDTRLVSVALANNELGTIQPLADIAAAIKAERTRRRQSGSAVPLYLHTDASQGAGLLEIKPAKLGVDMLTLNASKMYGPKGIGVLWASADVALRPLIVGGGQERGLRSGTENVPGIVGFAEAFERVDGSRKNEVKRMSQLRDHLEARLAHEFEDVVVTHPPQRLANFLHIAWPGLDAERIVFMLENEGVLVATGSACAANSGTRSHVLTAIGMEPSLADGSLRVTLGKENDAAAIEKAADAIIAAVATERRRTRQRERTL